MPITLEEVPDMDRRHYTAESLDRALKELEREYGMTTAVFYERYCAGERLDIPHFNQHVWASLHEDVQRMTNGNGVPREPVMARVNHALTAA